MPISTATNRLLVDSRVYDVPLAKKLTLRPSVFGEYSDRNFETTQSEAIRLTGGLNLIIGKKLRLLGEVELRRPVGEKTDFNPIKSRETYTLMAVAEF